MLTGLLSKRPRRDEQGWVSWCLAQGVSATTSERLWWSRQGTARSCFSWRWTHIHGEVSLTTMCNGMRTLIHEARDNVIFYMFSSF